MFLVKCGGSAPRGKGSRKRVSRGGNRKKTWKVGKQIDLRDRDAGVEGAAVKKPSGRPRPLLERIATTIGCRPSRTAGGRETRRTEYLVRGRNKAGGAPSTLSRPWGGLATPHHSNRGGGDEGFRKTISRVFFLIPNPRTETRVEP